MCSQGLATATIFLNRLSRFLSAAASVFRQCIFLLKSLSNQGRGLCVVLGFNTKDEVFYENEFKALGIDVFVATVDGSYGVKGFVTDAFPDDYDYFYTCGPLHYV